MKLFGRELFSFQKPLEPLYDFAMHGILNQPSINDWQLVAVDHANGTDHKRGRGRPKKVKPVVSPKALYELQALNNKNFAINVDAVYLDKQIELIDKKLDFMGKKPTTNSRGEGEFPGEAGGIHFGRLELESIKERLMNRKNIGKFQKTITDYPHTTSELISEILNKHDHLRCQKAGSFIPDLPKEAIEIMENYNEVCEKLCGKKTNFYVIADRKDFEKRDQRRDPILLAQSPFGHFWQVLGAWDKEMVYLAEL